MSTIKQIEERVARVEQNHSGHELIIKQLSETQIKLTEMISTHERSRTVTNDRLTVHQEMLQRLNAILANHDDMIARQDAMLANHDDMIARQDAMLANHDDVIARQNAILASHDERMAKLEAGLEETRRFNRQTRRLYVLIARKANWLDEDDIAEWENDND